MKEERQIKVLLGVTAGIAAYKSPEIVRRLVEQDRLARREAAANLLFDELTNCILATHL